MDDSHEDLSHLWREPKKGKDDGTDPPGDGDLEPDTQIMLLGTVLEFDQALSFENSLWSRRHTSAVGELSLKKPGMSKRLPQTFRFPLCRPWRMFQ